MSEEGTPQAPETTETPETSTESPWTAGLPEDARGYVEMKGWADPASVVESYKNLEHLQRVPRDRLLELPEDLADGEAMGAVFSRLGRPEKAEEYQIESLEVEGETNILPAFKEAAHGAGLSQAQAERLAGWYNELYEQAQTQKNEQAEQRATVEMTALKRDWGPEYDANVMAGKRAVQWLGLEGDDLEKLEEALGPRKLLEMTTRIGRGLGEHSQPGGDAEEGGFGMTTARARAVLEERYGPGSEGMLKIDNGDLAAQREFERLTEIATRDKERPGGPPRFMGGQG